MTVAVHLNQQAAFGSIIPRLDGVAVVFSEAEERAFAAAFASFWLPFQSGGPRAGTRPTNKEYGAALLRALEAAGCKAADARIIAGLAALERHRHGLDESAPVPELPSA